MKKSIFTAEKRVDIVSEDGSLAVQDFAGRLVSDLGEYRLKDAWYAFLGRFFVGQYQHLIIWHKDLSEFQEQLHALTYSPRSHVEIRLSAVMSEDIVSREGESGFITMRFFGADGSPPYMEWETVEEARERIVALSQTSNPTNSHN